MRADCSRSSAPSAGPKRSRSEKTLDSSPERVILVVNGQNHPFRGQNPPLASGANTMKKIIWTFGLISGAILSLMMVVTVPFSEKIGYDKGLVIGYTTM